MPLTGRVDADLRCPQCGYSLRGIPEERCPECNFHYDHEAVRSLSNELRARQRHAERRVRRLLLGVFLLVAIPTTAMLFGGSVIGAAVGQIVLVVIVTVLALREVFENERLPWWAPGLPAVFVVFFLCGVPGFLMVAPFRTLALLLSTGLLAWAWFVHVRRVVAPMPHLEANVPVSLREERERNRRANLLLLSLMSLLLLVLWLH